MLLRVARGAFALYRGLRLKLLGKKEAWRRVPAGFWMRINPEEVLDQTFFFGTYERALGQLFPLLIRPGDVCVDVGAHKGYMTLQLAKAVGRSGLVLAVEPDPRAFAALNTHCERNADAQIRRFNVALSDRSGQHVLNLTQELGNSSFFPNVFAQPHVIRQVTVETKTMDSLLAEAGVAADARVSFIKIDAEGAEPLILRGMQGILSSRRPVIHLEVNFESLKTAGCLPKEIEECFRAAGYELYQIIACRDSLLRSRVLLDVLSHLDQQERHMIDVLAVPSVSNSRTAIEPLIIAHRRGRSSAVCVRGSVQTG